MNSVAYLRIDSGTMRITIVELRCDGEGGIPSSVMLKKLSFDGTDSDVVLDAELTAA